MNKLPNTPLVGAIEAGGTKIVCAVGTGPDDLDRKMFPTGDEPGQVLSDAADWLTEQQGKRGSLHALGIGSFGPLELHERSPSYGHITSTPKPGWRDTDIVGVFRKRFPDIPIGFDTDVNAAALGEYRWGSGAGLSDFVYITIGTGIGAGGMVGGRLIHGLVHPEMGHMFIPRIPGDAFEGVCPYHGSCWEGMCSGPALERRSGMPTEQIPPEHESWEFETEYIAFALANIVCIISPERLILGGGVSKAGKLGSERFFKMIRVKVKETLNGYIVSPELNEEIDRYIVPPYLVDDAGICGAIALAHQALAST
jgi:fructokinase